MKMKVTIETYIDDPKDLVDVARQIREKMRIKEFNYYGEKFSFNTLILDEPEFRMEIVDDQIHYIYPSKMNKK